MAICLLTNTHWKTAAVEMAMLMLVTVIMSAATTSALPAHHGRLRVGRPCSGRHAESIELPSTSNTEKINVSHHQLRRAVRGVSNLLAALYDDVNRLKADYTTERHVVHIGMHVDGMPRSNDIGLHIAASHSQAVDLAATVADVTPKLSRVAVFISLLRLEEERHEPRPFKDELERIEDHSEHGLYGILCRLHVVHRLASAFNGTTNDDGVDLAANIDAALAGVQLVEASRPAHRHLRTVSVITDLAQLLQHLIVILDYTIQLPPSVMSTADD